MRQITITPGGPLRGEVHVPSDKSISQRAVMLSALCRGTTVVRRFLAADDSLRAVTAFGHMGISLRLEETAGETVVTITGKGLNGLTPPGRPLYLGNSGTTMRLLSGILAAQSFSSVLTGDRSLSSRPMERITVPLRRMGASITGRRHAGRECSPLKINGRPLQAICYTLPVPSAQVKSCVLLAGLYARGRTCVREPVRTRDHTERMLAAFGAPVRVRGRTVSIQGGEELRSPRTLVIPGDISSAAFFLVAASVTPGSDLLLRGVGVNPTRQHVISVLRRMGARLVVRRHGRGQYEPCADIRVRSGSLRGVRLSPADTAQCIDELPILGVAAALARGTTRFCAAGELRVKETDRIASMVQNLSAMGADIRVRGDDLVIRGGRKLHGAVVDSYGDHRTAMSLAIAALAAEGATTITNAGCVAKSYPGFFDDLAALRSG